MKRSKSPVLHTPRLCLRAMTPEDAGDVVKLLTHEEVGKTYMVPGFSQPEDVHKLFRRLMELSCDDERFVCGVYREDRLIGLINDVEICEDEVELGYVIHPRQKNRGFATEVLAAAIRELFSMGYSVVKAGAFAENSASMRVMEKCGMTPTGQDEDIPYRGRIHRCINYKIRKPM